MSTLALPRRHAGTQRTAFTGTRQLFLLAARRDRVLIPVSAALLTVLSVGSAQATLALYPTDADASTGLASVLGNPAAKALYGPLASPTADALAVFKSNTLGAVGVALLAYAVVRRHTRLEEEEGRLELLGAGVVGRRAPLAAAVLLSVVSVVGISLLTVLGLSALGMDPVGSLAVGAGWAIAGLGMTGVTAVAAQLTSTARGCTAFALGALLVDYVVRAVGDTVDAASALGWATPLGWALKVEAYGANRFWLLLPAVALMSACLVLADRLQGRRDLGAGVLPPRPGPVRAGRGLGSAGSLVRRLGRPTVLGWTVALLVLSLVLGSLVGAASDLLDDPQIQEFLAALGGTGKTLTDAYWMTELRFLAAGVAAAGISVAERLAAEERTGRGEMLLTTPTSRSRWFGANAALAVLLPAWLLLIAGVVGGTLGSRTAPGSAGALEVTAAALSTLPAVAVCVGAALALVGLSLRWAPMAWAVLGVAFLLAEVGPLLRLPDWLVALSPFDHLQRLPGGTFEPGKALVLTAVAAALTLLGWAAYRRRDLL
ncbi:MAG TPA: polyketide antibiotic transporter [Dermatophilaceae bacterium]|nr:polyketide antibiotic transporter [Dermatophilaceae bacterium]